MAVVVTGAAGFLGAHLVRSLAADGCDVVGIDRRAPVPQPATGIQADLANPLPASVIDALRQAEAVFHLAGCPGVRDRGADLDRQRWRDNVIAGRQVLTQVPHDTPVVVVSSSSVYGGAAVLGERPAPSREDHPLRPRGAYARSKVALERCCAARAADGGHVAVARPFTVAGEWQRPDMAIARWLAAAAAHRPLTVYGDVGRTRDVTDVRDVTEGLVRMARRGVTGAVNLGTGVARRLDEIINAVGQATGVPVAVALAPGDAVDPPHTLADTARCRRLLGFVPTTDLHDLVVRQAAAQPLTPALEIA